MERLRRFASDPSAPDWARRLIREVLHQRDPIDVYAALDRMTSLARADALDVLEAERERVLEEHR